jgi:hypothetical protein
MLLLGQIATERLNNKPVFQLDHFSGFFWVVCIAGGLLVFLLLADLIRDQRKKAEFRRYWERRHTTDAPKTLLK